MIKSPLKFAPKGPIYGFKISSGGCCCHNAWGRVQTGRQIPRPLGWVIGYTVHTSPSALWQQKPDRSVLITIITYFIMAKRYFFGRPGMSTFGAFATQQRQYFSRFILSLRHLLYGFHCGVTERHLWLVVTALASNDESEIQLDNNFIFYII